MHVRDYTSTDEPACLALFDSNVPDFFLPSERQDFRDFLLRLATPYFVVEDAAGMVVGCGGYAVDRVTRTARLCWGMVRHDLHRTGIGRALLEARLDRMRADGLVDAVELDTTQNTYAFFERWGFRTSSVEPEGYGPGMDRYEMRLDLNRATSSGGRD